MTVRPALHRSTVPLGVTALGALVVATGWLVLLGLPFALGCGLMCLWALGEIGLLTTRRDA